MRTEFGYHVIKVTDRKESGKQGFDEAKPNIVAYLSNQKKKAAVDELIVAMRSKAEVKMNLAAPAAPAPAAPQPAAKK